jgi:hypothetical protein
MPESKYPSLLDAPGWQREFSPTTERLLETPAGIVGPLAG